MDSLKDIQKFFDRPYDGCWDTDIICLDDIYDDCNNSVPNHIKDFVSSSLCGIVDEKRTWVRFGKRGAYSTSDTPIVKVVFAIQSNRHLCDFLKRYFSNEFSFSYSNVGDDSINTGFFVGSMDLE